MAFKYYMTVKGTRQGEILGEPKGTKGRSDRIGLASYKFETVAPVDSNAGQPVSKRRHNPVSVTKEIGWSDPQLYQAFGTGEVLSKVLIETVAVTGGGSPKEKVVPQISLINALLSQIRADGMPQAGTPSMGNPGKTGSGKGERVVERITLTNAVITRFASAYGSLRDLRASSGKGRIRLDFDFQMISVESYPRA